MGSSLRILLSLAHSLEEIMVFSLIKKNYIISMVFSLNSLALNIPENCDISPSKFSLAS